MKKRKKRRVWKKRIFILCICLFAFYCVSWKQNHGQTQGESSKKVVKHAEQVELSRPVYYEGEDLTNKLKKLSSTSKKYQKIYENRHAYPEELLVGVCNNEEMLPFALGYLKRDSVSAGGYRESELQGELPLLLQWDERWGYAPYGTSCVGLAGCAPTCLAMVTVGLTGEIHWTPDQIAKFAEEEGYYQEGTGTAWALMTEGAMQFGITGRELGLDQSVVKNELKNGHPIICSMGPGDFTSKGHFIVLAAWEDGAIRVHDPNSKKRSSVLWSYDTIASQVKNLWSFSA